MAVSELDALVGEELSAVSFVRDYVEFHFDGPVLRALTNVRVEHAGRIAAFPAPGSRDALCALIGQPVRAVTHQPEQHIRLAFADGAILTVPLDRRSYIGPEAAHFVPAGGVVAVFE